MTKQAIFGSGVLIAKQKFDAFGNAVSNPTPVPFATLQSASVSMSTDIKELYGSEGKYAQYIAQGKAKLEAKIQLGTLSSRIFELVLGQSSNDGEHKVAFNSNQGAIPSGATITISPPNSGVFDKDEGVIFQDTLVSGKRVASSPASGQYSVDESTGIYTFNSSDVSRKIFISYSYNTSANGGSLVIANTPMGFSPSFSIELSTNFQGQAMTLTLFNCIPNNFNLATKIDDYTLPEIDVTCSADELGRVFGWSTAV